ncbi:protein kinase [Micromonospora purpureochromogenes]|uniref:serine/threonine-protein kinase n=1 Tax=Micromonospora purpureochromogenes TaxID=47872 RepID=UPI00331C0D25
MQARDRIGDRYELTYPIGRGGMGQVWAGYDERLDRPVAVKFLRQMEVPENERETAVKRFRREARAVARLDHPGVPVVHDLGEHGDDLFIVMQLVPGMMLADLVAEQERLSVGQAASIAAQVCTVLAAAHAGSLVHRDLKPQNLMITPAGVVKVLDFGVAALIGPAEASRLTATGHTLGTPAYIAPEQAAGDAVGPAADLYAVGCILFEMLVGHPPYEGKTALDMLRQHMHSSVPVVTEHRSDVPDDLAHLLFCLLAKGPADRPAAAAEVAELLLPFAVPLPGSAGRAQAGASGSIGGARGGEVAERARRRPPQDLAVLHARAQELAEEERFAQAAEVLEQALEQAMGGSEPPDPRVVPLRIDLANLRMLAGNYRQARRDFEALAHGLERSEGDPDLAQHCRQQADVCAAELGEEAQTSTDTSLG